MSENTRAVRSCFQKTPGVWVRKNLYKCTAESTGVDETNWQRLWGSWRTGKTIKEEWSSKEKVVAWVLVPHIMSNSFGSVVCSHEQKDSRLFLFSTNKKSGWGWVWCTLLTCARQGKTRTSISVCCLRFLLKSFPQAPLCRKGRPKHCPSSKSEEMVGKNSMKTLGCLNVRSLDTR